MKDFFKFLMIWLPKITAGFSIVPPATTNTFHSSTESTATKRIEWEQKRNAYLERVQKAVNRLPYNERQIIIKRYTQQEPVFDYQVYNEIGMSGKIIYTLERKDVLRPGVCAQNCGGRFFRSTKFANNKIFT
ncbi:ArpU family phage packaging/lysis transcriptional regulator [Bacillus sp. WP8]